MANPFQSRLQDIVYNVDSGVGLRLIKVIIYVLCVISLMLAYTKVRFKGFNDAEAMDYAQLARNIQVTGDFTTRYIRPASLNFLQKNDVTAGRLMDVHPDIVHPPLYPALLAAGFAIGQPSFEVGKTAEIYSPERWVIIPLSHLCTLLTGLLLFFIGKRLFEPRAALLGVTLFFLSNAVWKTSISSKSAPMS